VGVNSIYNWGIDFFMKLPTIEVCQLLLKNSQLKQEKYEISLPSRSVVLRAYLESFENCFVSM